MGWGWGCLVVGGRGSRLGDGVGLGLWVGIGWGWSGVGGWSGLGDAMGLGDRVGWRWGGVGNGVVWGMGWVGGFALTPRDGITPSPTELPPFVPPGCPASPHCFSSWARSRSAAWRVGRWSRRASTRALLWAAKVGGGREKWDPLPPLPPSSHPPYCCVLCRVVLQPVLCYPKQRLLRVYGTPELQGHGG